MSEHLQSAPVVDLCGPEVCAAYVAACADLGTSVARDSEARVQSKRGASYSYTYASLGAVLAAVVPTLAKHGLAPMQTVEGEWLVTVLIHTSGQSLVCRVPLVVASDGRLSPTQEVGSALSYARRYGLLTMLALATEDDDGHGAGRQERATSAVPGMSMPQYRAALKQLDVNEYEANVLLSRAPSPQPNAHQCTPKTLRAFVDFLATEDGAERVRLLREEDVPR